MSIPYHLNVVFVSCGLVKQCHMKSVTNPAFDTIPTLR